MSSLDAMFLGYSSTICFCFPEGKDVRDRMALSYRLTLYLLLNEVVVAIITYII
jgi:hypothetical protein